MNQRIQEIQRAIVKIENPYPLDNLIVTYKDFVKVRDFLSSYKYNPKVLHSMVDLTCRIWDSSERISRISLLEKIKLYGFRKLPGMNFSYDFNIDTRKKIFILFKNSFEKYQALTEIQIKEARKICNYILINLSLSTEEEKWLCLNADKDKMILNRILRYPKISSEISQWASENFNNDKLRSRRAELTGWIIDQNPQFELSTQILIDDFEYFNTCDLKAIREYDDDQMASQIIERDFKGVLNSKKLPTMINDLGFGITPEFIMNDYTELILTKRFYPIPIDSSKSYPVAVPDFKALRNDFYSKIDLTLKISMLWAIAYSRLPEKMKTELLKKYYCDEIYWSFLKICEKYKLLDLLKWLKGKQLD